VKPVLISATIIAALGGLLFGFDTAVISGTKAGLEDAFGLAQGDYWLGLSGSFWYGFTVASALIGTIVGAIVAGRPADTFGRRTALISIGVLYTVSAVGSALAWNWGSFLLFRFLGGLGVGGASVVSPMYIAEISPARYRGRLVAVTQFNIVFGILLAYLSNYMVAQFQLGAIEWRWMFGVEAFPALAFFCLLFAVPLSPRWLLSQDRVDEARAVLDKLGTDTGNVDEEVKEIQASLDLAHHTLKEPFFRKVYLKPIMLAVAIAAFNQLSGINALIYYAPHIFKMAGAGKSTALLSSVGVGMMNLLFTMAALLVIDYFGRRKLMLAGSIGYILSLGAVAWAFYSYGPEFSAAKALNNAVEACDAAAKSPDTATANTFADAAEAVKADPQAAETFTAVARACNAAAATAADPKAATALTDAAEALDSVASDPAVSKDLDAVAGGFGAAAKAAEVADPAAAKALDAAAKVCNAAIKTAATDPAANIATGSLVVLVGLLVFIAAHAFGQGAVIWVFISEIFPNRVRARGQALGSFTHWFMAAAISWTFPMIADWSGGNTFAFYGAMMVLQLLWVLLIMPETKGIPLEQIQKRLGIE